MCDLSNMRKIAESGQPVTLDAKTFLKLLEAAETITAVLPAESGKRGAKPGTEKDMEVARWMFEEVLQPINPTAKEPNFATWAREIRLMRECDGRTHKEIGGLFRWAQQDSFWCANILSPAKLRKQWDTLVMQRRRADVAKQPTQPQQLGKQGQATAQNAQRWLEENGHAA